MQIDKNVSGFMDFSNRLKICQRSGSLGWLAISKLLALFSNGKCSFFLKMSSLKKIISPLGDYVRGVCELIGSYISTLTENLACHLHSNVLDVRVLETGVKADDG